MMSRIIKVGSTVTAYSVVNEQQFLNFLSREYGSCLKDEIHGSNENLVIGSPQATSDIISHFAWGKTHPLNVFEQQAGLVGHLFKTDDPSKSKFIVVVEYIVPMFPDNRNTVAVNTGNEELTKMYKEIKTINQNANASKYSTLKDYGEYIFLGIVHSHPNGLDVFMSGTDMETHREWHPSRDAYGLSMVINPHRRLKVVYGGPDVIKTKCVYYVFPEDYERWTGEKNHRSKVEKERFDVGYKNNKDVISERELQKKLSREEKASENGESNTVKHDRQSADLCKESDVIISQKNMLEIKRSKRNENAYELLVHAPSYTNGLIKPQYDDGPFKFIYEFGTNGKVMYIKSSCHISHPLVDKKGYIRIPSTLDNAVDVVNYILKILSFDPDCIMNFGRNFDKWYHKKYEKGEVPTFTFMLSQNGEK